MVSLEEAVNMVTALPNVTEGTRWGRRTWSVGKNGVAWERPLSKADLKRLGGQPPPAGPILALTVEDVGVEALGPADVAQDWNGMLAAAGCRPACTETPRPPNRDRPLLPDQS